MNADPCPKCQGPLGTDPVTLTTASREVQFCAMSCLIANHKAQLDALGAVVGLDPAELRPAAAREGVRMWLDGYIDGRRDGRQWAIGFRDARSTSRRGGTYLPSTPVLSTTDRPSGRS